MEHGRHSLKGPITLKPGSTLFYSREHLTETPRVTFSKASDNDKEAANTVCSLTVCSSPDLVLDVCSVERTQKDETWLMLDSKKKS